MTSALIASWIAILLLALVVSGLVRQVHQLSRGAGHRPERVGLRPGSAAPSADDVVPRQQSAVLLFLSPDCRTCTDVLAVAEAWTAAEPVPVLRALYAGPAPERPSAIPAIGDRPELFEEYGAIATPFAVSIDRDGRVIRSDPLGSPDALRRLLESIRSNPVGSTA